MSSTNTRYKQIVHDNNNQSFGTNTTRWPSYDSRWDDPNRILCLAAGAGDILALKWALEEHRLIIHGHPVRRSKITIYQYNESLNQPTNKSSSAMTLINTNNRIKKQYQQRMIMNNSNNGYTPDWSDPFCYGWTAIHRAASSGKKNTIKFLLDHGWHLNKKTW